jgi:SAM-dependent methyltransferase
MSNFAREVTSGERFEFGKNWTSFLTVLDAQRIQTAVDSLKEMLDVTTLEGQTFLDAGSGSGLFSLAARRLGARVTSFDYDPNSVACTKSLRDRFYAGDDNWQVTAGSVLDSKFVKSLGQFDIVYSWGVLHHTGDMWSGLDIVRSAVREGGSLFIMIYEDRGWKSKAWRAVKRTYCSGPVGRVSVLGAFLPYYIIRGLAEDVVALKNPLRRYREYKSQRGMSKYHDWIDWLGGYPYEVATPEQLQTFYADRNFHRVKTKVPEYIFTNKRAA